MKVLLIEPPSLKLVCHSPSETFAIPIVRTHHPKIQLQILASALKNLRDTEIEIIDMKMCGNQEVHYKTFDFDGLRFECYRYGADFSECEEQILRADCIGISSPFTHAAQIVADLCRFIKRINPRVKMVVGGYDTIEPSRQRFYLEAGFDRVIPQRGETEMIKYIVSEFPHVQLRPTTNSLPGKDNVTPLTLPLPNLDLVDYRCYVEAEDGMLPQGAKLPLGYFISSRGCDRHCGFCTIWRANKGKYELMALDDIERLLKHYKEHNVTTLLHAESSLLTRLKFGENGRRHLMETMRLMRSHGFAWEFFDGIEFCRLIQNDGKTPDKRLIESLFAPEMKGDALVGGYRAYVPIEASFNERRERFDKLALPHVQDEIVASIVETGVKQLSFGIILGWPEETNKSLEYTRKRVSELRNLVDKYSSGRTETLFIFYVHTLFPDSFDYQIGKDALLVDINKNPELFQLYTGCKGTAEFGPSQITLVRRSLDYEFNGAITNSSEITGRAPTLHPCSLP